MKVLVTGGCGFLGKYVTKLLGAYALDNHDPRCGGSTEGLAWIDCDVTDYPALEKVILENEFSHIVHLAAYGRNLTCRDFPQDAWRINVHGTKHVLMIAHKHPKIVKRVVVCSSNIVLSNQGTEYKFTKRAAEHEVGWYAKLGVSCMGLRPSNIAGVGQSRTEHQLCAFAALDECFRRCGHFEISGNGEQTRDFINAADVARAFELALDSNVSGVTIDVATGAQISMNEIAKKLGVPVKYTDPRPGDARELISDIEPAKKLLNFTAEIGIDQTLRESFPSVMEARNAKYDGFTRAAV